MSLNHITDYWQSHFNFEPSDATLDLFAFVWRLFSLCSHRLIVRPAYFMRMVIYIYKTLGLIAEWVAFLCQQPHGQVFVRECGLHVPFGWLPFYMSLPRFFISCLRHRKLYCLGKVVPARNEIGIIKWTRSRSGRKEHMSSGLKMIFFLTSSTFVIFVVLQLHFRGLKITL